MEIVPTHGTQCSSKTPGDSSTPPGGQVGQNDDSCLCFRLEFLPIGHYNEVLEEFTFSINEHYFLTDPDEMQFSHFPFLQVDS